MRLLSKEVFIKFHDRSVAPGFITYIHPTRPILIHRIAWVTGDDYWDDICDIVSRDNGITWSAPATWYRTRSVEGGELRYGENAGLFDADTGKLITMINRAVYPKRTHLSPRDHQIAQWRFEICLYNPADDTWDEPQVLDLGFPQRTMISFCQPIKTSQGRLLFPASTAMVDRDANAVHCPGYPAQIEHAFVVMGDHDEKGVLSWRASDLVVPDMSRTSCGVNEPAIVELRDGRIAMICRGDNGFFPEKPGYKWLCFSENNGRSWSEPVPLGCTEGEPIESGSNGSFVTKSVRTGKIYWIGNPALDARPNGNNPRTTLAVFEVQEEPFALKRETMTIIDRAAGDDGPRTQLSNFRCYQDRESGDLVLLMSRWGEMEKAEGKLEETGWMMADYYRYRIEID